MGGGVALRGGGYEGGGGGGVSSTKKNFFVLIHIGFIFIYFRDGRFSLYLLVLFYALQLYHLSYHLWFLLRGGGE